MFARSILRRHAAFTPRTLILSCKPYGEAVSCFTSRTTTLLPTAYPPVFRSISSKVVPQHVHKLEVERKFVPNSPLISLLRNENLWSGPEALNNLTPPQGLRFADVYFDTPDFRLRSTGIYVRRRNGEWEMKTRRTGGLVSTGCIEVVGQARVERLLGERRCGVLLEDLGRVAEMETLRRAWGVGEFTVLVDDSTLLLRGLENMGSGTLEIPHRVGEVELCKDVEGGSEEAEVQDMIERIDIFMEKYEDVFGGRNEKLCSDVPEGKLAAFFRWEEAVGKMHFLPTSRWDEENRGFADVLRRKENVGG